MITKFTSKFPVLKLYPVSRNPRPFVPPDHPRLPAHLNFHTTPKFAGPNWQNELSFPTIVRRTLVQSWKPVFPSSRIEFQPLPHLYQKNKYPCLERILKQFGFDVSSYPAGYLKPPATPPEPTTRWRDRLVRYKVTSKARRFGVQYITDSKCPRKKKRKKKKRAGPFCEKRCKPEGEKKQWKCAKRPQAKKTNVCKDGKRKKPKRKACLKVEDICRDRKKKKKEEEAKTCGGEPTKMVKEESFCAKVYRELQKKKLEAKTTNRCGAKKSKPPTCSTRSKLMEEKLAKKVKKVDPCEKILKEAESKPLKPCQSMGCPKASAKRKPCKKTCKKPPEEDESHPCGSSKSLEVKRKVYAKPTGKMRSDSCLKKSKKSKKRSVGEMPEDPCGKSVECVEKKKLASDPCGKSQEAKPKQRYKRDWCPPKREPPSDPCSKNKEIALADKKNDCSFAKIDLVKPSSHNKASCSEKKSDTCLTKKLHRASEKMLSTASSTPSGNRSYSDCKSGDGHDGGKKPKVRCTFGDAMKNAQRGKKKKKKGAPCGGSGGKKGGVRCTFKGSGKGKGGHDADCDKPTKDLKPCKKSTCPGGGKKKEEKKEKAPDCTKPKPKAKASADCSGGADKRKKPTCKQSPCKKGKGSGDKKGKGGKAAHCGQSKAEKGGGGAKKKKDPCLLLKELLEKRKKLKGSGCGSPGDKKKLKKKCSDLLKQIDAKGKKGKKGKGKTDGKCKQAACGGGHKKDKKGKKDGKCKQPTCGGGHKKDKKGGKGGKKDCGKLTKPTCGGHKDDAKHHKESGGDRCASVCGGGGKKKDHEDHDHKKSSADRCHDVCLKKGGGKKGKGKGGDKKSCKQKACTQKKSGKEHGGKVKQNLSCGSMKQLTSKNACKAGGKKGKKDKKKSHCKQKPCKKVKGSGKGKGKGSGKGECGKKGGGHGSSEGGCKGGPPCHKEFSTLSTFHRSYNKTTVLSTKVKKAPLVIGVKRTAEVKEVRKDRTRRIQQGTEGVITKKYEATENHKQLEPEEREEQKVLRQIHEVLLDIQQGVKENLQKSCALDKAGPSGSSGDVSPRVR